MSTNNNTTNNKYKIFFDKTSKYIIHKDYEIARAKQENHELIPWDGKPFYKVMKLDLIWYHVRFKDLEQGYTHQMSCNLLLEAKEKMNINNWIVAGKWTFVKRGTEVFLKFLSNECNE